MQHIHIPVVLLRYMFIFIPLNVLLPFTQGLNTGIHDAMNLGWKLSGFLAGQYTNQVLDTYDSERRSAAQRLIQIDKDLASLMSGDIPSHYEAPPHADANLYLNEVVSANAAFTVGLGITYKENLINKPPGTDSSLAPGMLTARVGHRVPDALVWPFGSTYPQPFRTLIPYNGGFKILVFAGRVYPSPLGPRLSPKQSLVYHNLQQHISSPLSFMQALAVPFDFLTIIRGEGVLQVEETLGCPPIGKVLLDCEGEMYIRFGVRYSSMSGLEGTSRSSSVSESEEKSGVVVVRPDGVLSSFAPLEESIDALGRYFSPFIVKRGRFVANEAFGAANIGWC
jgi:phenol 2-monooxygenase (NADPH)